MILTAVTIHGAHAAIYNMDRLGHTDIPDGTVKTAKANLKLPDSWCKGKLHYVFVYGSLPTATWVLGECVVWTNFVGELCTVSSKLPVLTRNSNGLWWGYDWHLLWSPTAGRLHMHQLTQMSHHTQSPTLHWCRSPVDQMCRSYGRTPSPASGHHNLQLQWQKYAKKKYSLLSQHFGYLNTSNDYTVDRDFKLANKVWCPWRVNLQTKLMYKLTTSAYISFNFVPNSSFCLIMPKNEVEVYENFTSSKTSTQHLTPSSVHTLLDFSWDHFNAVYRSKLTQKYNSN